MGNLQSPLPVPPLTPNAVPTPLSQYWPILCKGQANRLIFAGPPTIEKEWHKALEEGRKLEGSVNEAMYSIIQQKQEIQARIMHYLDLNQVCADSQFRHGNRKWKLAADILTFISKIHTFMQDLQGLTQAIQTNLQILQTIEAQTQSMIQNNLNALANFMLQMCNLGMPPLPSIPTFMGTNIFSFNGYDLQNLVPRNISVAAFTNFSFAQCTLVGPNLGIYNQPPVVVNFEGYTVGSTAGNFVPPLQGQLGDASQLTPTVSPTYMAEMQGQTTTPIYNPNTVNPTILLQGSLPDPGQIISAYQMPQATYKANVLSTIPAMQPIITAQNATQEYTLLSQNVNLSSIVSSNYNKNVTAAWLYYLEAARLGRAGTWLPNFEAAYQTYLQPSLTVLDSPQTVVPWNTVLGGTGTVNAPASIPLIDTLAAMSPAQAQNVLWQLSYIEASLLGYTRTTQFDSGVDSTYLETFTLNDLDYKSTTYDLTNTVQVILGADTASYPVACTVPKAILNVFNEVVAVASTNIAADQTYVTSKPQFRYTYNAFAQATQVDRFTQFWRTLNYNFQQLLAQGPYVVGFVVSYEASLDSAIDPLGTVTDYNQIENDALTRNRSWLPGQPLLPLPVPPVVTIGTLPGLSTPTTGWSSAGFDISSFLARPDIQSLPLTTQLAMLRTNESYAGIMTTAGQIQTAIDTAIALGQTALVSLQNNGFNVTSTGPLTVKNNVNPLPVSFDKIGYNNTNYVTSPTLFTIQVAGLYMISGTITWNKGPAGVRTVMLMQNSTIVLDEEQTDVLSVGPIIQNFSAMQQMNAGDTLQVLVTQSTGVDTEVLSEAEFSVLLVPASDANPQPVYTDVDTPSGDNRTRSLIADVTMVAGVAVAVQPDGGVAPVDPVGALATPFVDGLVIDPVQKGATANVATGYGSVYTIAGANYTVGGLLYAGPGGVLTQNYPVLATQVKWIIVVGRAVAPDMVIFEPHIPTKVM